MTRLNNLQYTRDLFGGIYSCEVETDDTKVINYLGRKTLSFKTEEENILPGIKDVIFNPPATIVLWEDGTKTVVKIDDRYDKGYQYDPEKGLAMAIAKKVMGNKGNYYEVFKKYIWDKDDDFLNTYKDYPAIVPRCIDTNKGK